MWVEQEVGLEVFAFDRQLSPRRSCSKKKKSAYKKAHLKCEKVKGGYRLK